MNAPEKAKRQPTRYNKKWIFIIAIAVFVCPLSIIGLVAVTWGNSYTMCFGTPLPSDASVEESAFFKLPPSAHNLHYDAKSSGSHCTIWSKFEMTTSDLEIFQDSTLIKKFETTRIKNEIFLYFLQKKGWTQPADSLVGSGSYYNYYSYPQAEQWIMVDTTDPSNFIVYIIVDSWFLD